MAILTNIELATVLGVSTSANNLDNAVLWSQRAAEAFVGYPLERATVTEYYPRSNTAVERDVFVDQPVTSSLWTRGYASRRHVLNLSRLPVQTSGLTVYEDDGAYGGQVSGSFASSTALTLGEDFVLDIGQDGVSESGRLLRIGGAWPSRIGSVKVTYSAGYSANELIGDTSGAGDFIDASDIKDAIMLTAMFRFNELAANAGASGGSSAGPIVSESIEGYSYQLDSSFSARQLGMSQELPAEAKLKLQRYVNIARRMVA